MPEKENEESRKSAEGARARSSEISPSRHREARDIDRWFDDFGRRFDLDWPSFGPWFGHRGRWWPELSGTRRPFTDLVDSGGEYRVMAEVPGIPKEKLKVTITDREATIEGEASADVREEKEGYIRRERGYSKISRTVLFPEPVIAEKAEASVNNGVLELRVPKKEPVRAAKHRVAVK